MAKPRPATSEEVEFVRQYIENAGIKIDNCEIRVSAAGNIVCKNRATQQDILVIPKEKTSIPNAQLSRKQSKKLREKEWKRIENEKRARADKIQKYIKETLILNLNAAIKSITENQKSTKYNPFIGKIRADLTTHRSYDYDVDASIVISLDVIKGKKVIGSLTGVERKIDCENLEKESSIDELEKKLMSAVKRPTQRITVEEPVLRHMFGIACQYLKKQKDLKIDQGILSVIEFEERAIFNMINTISSRKINNPIYVEGILSDLKFKSGRILFTYCNRRFSYDIAADTVEFEIEEKEHLLILAEQLNAQKKNIKQCKKSMNTVKMALIKENIWSFMKLEMKNGILYITESDCIGEYEIKPNESITSAKLKKWFKQARMEYQEEQRKIKEEKYDKIRILKSYSNLLCIDVLRVIAKNERYITETAVVKNLRGMAQTLSSNVEDIENSGKYEILTNEEVEAAVRQLLRDKLIYEKDLKGTYGHFDILKLEDKASEIFATPFKEESKSFTSFTDLDWVNYLKKIKESGKEPRLSKAKKEQQLTLLEHKSVIAVYPELVKEFLKTRPKEWQMYIETMYSMAAGVEKKYWKCLRDMVVEKKERKKKKETETIEAKIEQKTEKTKAKTETKTEPAA